MKTTRYSGVLLHPTSLPSPCGCGDLGKSARHFVDWLKTGCQSLWQILPLVDAGIGNSPYMSPSAFGGNVLLIDLEDLMENGWLTQPELTPEAPFDNRRVNYPAVTRFRLSRLKMAASRFFASAAGTARESFADFCQIQASWLNDYALFRTLDAAYGGKQAGWQNWPEKLARREPQALKEAAKTYAQDIRFWQFCQWRFHEQWGKLKRYANENGVAIVGDVPIFVSLNSADVWAAPELFLLNERGFPTVVSGVPPDQFSETGQRWGNPLYNWEAMAQTGYQWWAARIAHTMALHDLVRIDHFRGFEAYWEIPADEPTAIGGAWKKGPGEAFFRAMQQTLGSLNFIAEDLGVITPEVIALRRAFSLPGMRILQFAFDQDPNNLYLPHNHTPDSVVYTGTHDNNTTRGWWQNATEQERDQARRYLSVNGDWIHWDLIRTALASVARYAIAPMQDILGLGAESRMNAPGQPEGAWEWRFSWDQVEGWYAAHLAEMTRLYGRVPDNNRQPPAGND
ncbi:MAG: 4-alpha-glucanotransferase [Alistipes senegalensis]|nr:4-alpha-glucanotransferase [Oxalobacter formigenes]MCM1280384.1 4-alpha-glucanotransferase [Alistipes senegalensis]